MRQEFYRLKPILDTEDRFAFFGVPKAATQSVIKIAVWDRAIVAKYDLPGWERKMESYSDLDLVRLFRFGIIRNPWDRLVSAYHYLKMKDWLDDPDFQMFVKKIHYGYLPDYHQKVRDHVVSMYSMLFSKDDEILVNSIVRLEDIERDWWLVASVIGCMDKLPKRNKSKRGHYRDYYDKETVEMVRKYYSRDIEVFGYEY